jgi:hypothetical protein
MTHFEYDPETGRVLLCNQMKKPVAERYIEKGLTEEEFIDKLVKAIEEGRVEEHPVAGLIPKLGRSKMSEEEGGY